MKTEFNPSTLLPIGRCDNCMWYFHYEEEASNGCPKCKTNEYLMAMPEIKIACNAHEDLVLACKEAALHIAEMAKIVKADYKNSPTFKRIIAAIKKAEGK